MAERAGPRPTVPEPRRPDAAAGDDGAFRFGATDDDGVCYRSERTLVRRVPHPDGVGTVIVKQAFGPAARGRIRHERGILARLEGIDGVPRLLATDREDALVLEDVGDRSLAELRAAGLGPSGPDQVLRFALELARLLVVIHAAGVIHRDLNPYNIMMPGLAAGQVAPVVVDYDLATTFAQLRPDFVQPYEIAGRLPYLAPEQTGRTGQVVDQRADLYAVGATVYEVATGLPPCGDAEPLRLLRDILTRVPDPASGVNEHVPAGLSRVLARLLEKEPAARYQSAAGLVHDLSLLVTAPEASFPLGVRDFPERLSALARPVGRDAEIARLTAALDRAAHGPPPLVLVSGDPGVGKSSLLDQLRPLVAARGGWFVAGKADQYQGGTGRNLLGQALGALARLLLAEPQRELDRLRARAPEALGSEGGLIAGVVPDFGRLLGIDPEEPPEDPSTQIRLGHAVRDLLRLIASPGRPLVILLDDLQWAGQSVLGILDGLLDDDGPAGLLLLGAYRDRAVDAAHPLTPMVQRWERLYPHLHRIHLHALARVDLADLLAQMLHLAPDDASALSAVIGERTGGNPFDTVELLNALRRDGALALTDDGWRWDDAAIRQYIGAGDVVDLLQQRLDQLPGGAGRALQIMACLGNEVDAVALAAACDLTPADLMARLLPALEDGLLLATDGDPAPAGTLRFRHDRVQQAAREGLDADTRVRVNLLIARRLAASGRFEPEAAQQYLQGADLLADRPATHDAERQERRQVVGLFRRAAEQARRANDLVAAEQYLAAATGLHQRAGGIPDAAITEALDVARHATLVLLGRLQEADEVYDRIAARQPDPLDLTGPGSLQITSISVRRQPRTAVAFGLDLLAGLGLDRPEGDLRAVIAAGYERAEQWSATCSASDDLSRPEVTDPAARAAASILGTLAGPAFFTDHLLQGWLVVQALGLWAEHGPQADLIPCLSHANSFGLGLRPTPDLDRQIVQRALAVGEARGHQRVTAMGHFLHAVLIGHWYEPFEQVVAEARAARETLLHCGDPIGGSKTFYPSVCALADCAPTLESLQVEAATGLALSRRVGNGQVEQSLIWYDRLAQALRGSAAPVQQPPDEPPFDETAALAAAERTYPMAAVYAWTSRALRAAIDGDAERLAACLAAAEPVQSAVNGTSQIPRLEFLRGVSAAQQLRAGVAPRAQLLARLEASRDALHAWSGPSPANFGHLALFLDAEHAALTGDPATAMRAYDAALQAADLVVRPWHHALIAERAGLFALDQGWTRAGLALLSEARRRYGDWGASAKVQALERAHPDLRSLHSEADQRSRTGSLGLTSDAMDMMGILAASQALASQTDPDQLQAVLADHLRSLAGATIVRLVTRDAGTGGWSVRSDERGTQTMEQAAASGRLPLSAFQVVRRTQEPVLVTNAALDDRFARDPYLAGRERCSLLCIPIVTAGRLRAILILVNDLASGAFTTDRLDAVQLIAGQLAVSLDNAQVYRSLETMVASRTRELEAAKQELEMLSLTDPLTQVANRRRFEQALASEWATAVASRRSLAVVMLDIDHFKHYNDAYGHPAGDHCIRQVADAIIRAVRQQDVVARYGGEEFAVILSGATASLARRVAERIRTTVRDLGLDHPTAGSVAVSLGVAACIPDSGGAPQGLVDAADVALYRAKRLGRNRVETSDPDPGDVRGDATA